MQDLDAQFTDRNAELARVKVRCRQRGPSGREEFEAAKAETEQWRGRAAGFKRRLTNRLRELKAQRRTANASGRADHRKDALRRIADLVEERRRPAADVIEDIADLLDDLRRRGCALTNETKELPMSTNDVPGANVRNGDALAMGAWAEHDDGSLILVESVEAGRVIYSVFDIAVEPPVEYRDAMPERGFKAHYSWRPDDLDSVRWTWHDKTPFPWGRVMGDFPAGQRHVSAIGTISVAQRVARSLDLRAEEVSRDRPGRPSFQRAASKIFDGLRDAIGALRP